MKAIVAVDMGPRGRLVLREVKDPEPGPGEVLVVVNAVGVNGADLLLRRGYFGPGDRIPGIDVAGRIVAHGPGAGRIPVGAAVLLNPAVTCDACRHCLSGRHGACRSRSALGQRRDGGYAELVVVPEANAHLLDDGVDANLAAAVPANYLTAWQMLFERARLTPADTVLVTGAAGGVGGAVVELAHRAGARVIGVVGSAAKAGQVRRRGAETVIDHSSRELAPAVLAATQGEGADVVIDVLGGSMWPSYLEAAATCARLVTCSITAGSDIPLTIEDLKRKELSIQVAGASGAKPMAATLARLLNRGGLSPVVDRVLPLEQAAAALALVEDRAVVGKILLRP